MPASKNRQKRKKPRQQKKKRSHLAITVALYGPTDAVATKMVASAIHEVSGDTKEMKKWYSEGPGDVREIEAVVRGLADMIEKWKPDNVISPDRIIGCPHEEGIDYPDGTSCPECPFWAGRDRFTGGFIQ